MRHQRRPVLSVLLPALVLVSVGAGPARSATPVDGAMVPYFDPAAADRAFADARRAEVRFPGGRVIAAQIADTPERIMYGYMFRPEVGEDDGMVFVFPESGVHSFWMKNTLVPLDIIWMDDARVILHVQAAAPPCRADPCPGYMTMRAASYVLEVRAGTAAREGLKRGDRLTIVFPGEPGPRR
jgi:uncharacterized membrane protein (UPF0127 family)